MEKFSWDTIVHYMDDEIREEIHRDWCALGPYSRQIFLEKYLVEHKKKYGEIFTIN